MQIFQKLLDRLNLLSSLGIFFLIGLISLDVIGRSFFGFPLPGVPEIVRFSVVCMFWMQMAYVLRIGGHLRTTLIFDRLPTSGKRIVQIVNTVLGSAIMVMILSLAGPELIKAWEIGEFEGALPVRIPVWPIWAVIIIGAALTALQYLSDLVTVASGGTIRDSDSDGTETI